MVQKYCAFGVLAPLPPKHGRAQWSIERLLDSPPPLPEAFHKSSNVTGFMIRNKLRKTPESSGLLANPLFQQTPPKIHVVAVQIELVFAGREGWHHTAKVCRSSSQPTELKTRDAHMSLRFLPAKQLMRVPGGGESYDKMVNDRSSGRQRLPQGDAVRCCRIADSRRGESYGGERELRERGSVSKGASRALQVPAARRKRRDSGNRAGAENDDLKSRFSSSPTMVVSYFR